VENVSNSQDLEVYGMKTLISGNYFNIDHIMSDTVLRSYCGGSGKQLIETLTTDLKNAGLNLDQMKFIYSLSHFLHMERGL
jgi:hypothetical protein